MIACLMELEANQRHPSISAYDHPERIGIPMPPKNTKKKRKIRFRRHVTKELLFTFKAEAFSEPFMSLVVSQGMYKQDERKPGFRYVEYRIEDHPDGEGQLLMRMESSYMGRS